jgi:hypothetical protein
MEIFRDLSDEQLTDMLLKSDEQCLRHTLESLPGCARTATEHQDVFWQRQRTAIRQRIAHAQWRRLRFWPALAAVAAVAAVAVVLFGALPGGLGHRVNSPEPQAQNQVDPDYELLVKIEQSVESEGPEALQPAALLAQEIRENTASSRGTMPAAGEDHP